MMDMMRNWLLGIAGVAFLLALAEGMMPDGTAKRVGKLTGGLLLFVVMFRPLVGMDFESLALQVTQYDWENDSAYQAIKTENEKLTAQLIGEDLSAYIEKKAKELGAECSVAVTCKENPGGMQIPESVKITGRFSAQTQKALSQVIQDDLDIPSERQYFIPEEQP